MPFSTTRSILENLIHGDVGVTSAHNGDTRSAFGQQAKCKAVTAENAKTIWASARKMSTKNFVETQKDVYIPPVKSDLRARFFAKFKVFERKFDFACFGAVR